MTATARAPRQLDIIADTALRAEYSASSSVRSGDKVQCFVKRNDKATKYSASSSVGRVAQINRSRIAAGLSHDDLCRRAKATTRNWFRVLRGEQEASNALLIRLEAALDAPREAKAPRVIAAFHRLVMQLIAQRMGFDVPTLLATDFSKQRPGLPLWLRAARIRQMAIYITAVELEVSNADLGRAIGDTRANIKYARDAIEDRREPGSEIDDVLTIVSDQVRGP